MITSHRLKIKFVITDHRLKIKFVFTGHRLKIKFVFTCHRLKIKFNQISEYCQKEDISWCVSINRLQLLN